MSKINIWSGREAKRGWKLKREGILEKMWSSSKETFSKVSREVKRIGENERQGCQISRTSCFLGQGASQPKKEGFLTEILILKGHFFLGISARKWHLREATTWHFRGYTLRLVWQLCNITKKRGAGEEQSTESDTTNPWLDSSSSHLRSECFNGSSFCFIALWRHWWSRDELQDHSLTACKWPQFPGGLAGHITSKFLQGDFNSRRGQVMTSKSYEARIRYRKNSPL